jgi:adenylylsulfate kinase
VPKRRRASPPSRESVHRVAWARLTSPGIVNERREMPQRVGTSEGPVNEPAVLWFTGLSGAGKSTIAADVYARLLARGTTVEYLDGDAIRSVFPQTGFDRVARDAHVRRVGFLASRLEHHGVTVVCALISPYQTSRAHVRRMCRRFVEIHVATPIDICERRDAKGLYRRARCGEIANFTGIDDPYEPPPNPELSIDTTCLTVAAATDMVMAMLDCRAEKRTRTCASVPACQTDASTPIGAGLGILTSE